MRCARLSEIMLVTIPNVLNKEDISVIQDLMATANFHQGTTSAGSEARRVKNNHEMFISEAETQRLNNLVMGKLVQNPTYIAAAHLNARVVALTLYFFRYSGRTLACNCHNTAPIGCM